MNTINVIVLTLLNTIACLALPKLLSVIMAAKNKPTAPLPTAITSQSVTIHIPPCQQLVKKQQELVGAKNPCEPV
jgi:hypothetical protein